MNGYHEDYDDPSTKSNVHWFCFLCYQHLVLRLTLLHLGMSLLKLYAVFFLLIAESARQSCGGGVLTVKAVHFENPSSQLSNGSCCDGADSETGSCDSCEYYFRFCLSFFGKNDCMLLNVTTCVLTNAEFYLFPTSFRSHQSNRVIKNPMVAEVDNWVGSLSLAVNVFDEDASNSTKDDHISLMEQNVTLVANNFGAVQSKQPVVLLGEQRASGVVPMLTLELSMQCDEYYLVPNCWEYCIDNPSGHYTCNYAKGSRDCHHGWYGPRCNVHCLPRNDPLGHFSCKQNGTKSCLPGWIDVSTNCTRENSTNLMLMTTTLLATTPKKFLAVLSTTKQTLQQCSTLDITASDIEPLPSRSSARICNIDIDCTTVTDEHANFTQHPNSDSRVFVLSSVWITSHTGVQFDEESYPSFSMLSDTFKLEPINSYIKVTESSNKDGIVNSSDMTLFFQSFDSTLPNEELLSTVGDRGCSSATVAETLQHKDGATSSCTDRQSLKLIVHERTFSYTPTPYLATVPDSELYWPTRKPIASSAVLTDASPFTVATHSIRISSEATVHSSPFTASKHQVSLSTIPSFQTTIVDVIKSHSTIPSLQSIHSSTIREQNQTRKQAMADRRRSGGVWQRNKYFFLATFGFFVLVIMLAIVVARIKRKNRVQSLSHSRPHCHDETNLRSTIIGGDNIDSHNPYILVHRHSSTSLSISNYRSSASFKSSESPTQTDAAGYPRSSSFLAAKAPNDAVVDDCIAGDCQSHMNKWQPIKCWTPVENQVRVGKNGPLVMHNLEDEHPIIDFCKTKGNSSTRTGYRTPTGCSLTKECFSRKRHLSAGEGPSAKGSSMPKDCLTPMEFSTPASHHSPTFIKKRSPFLRRIADDVQHGCSSSMASVRTESLEMDRVQNFSIDHGTDREFVHRATKSARMRNSTPFRTESISERAVNIGQRKSTSGSERLIGSQLSFDKAPKEYPSILLTEANTCCNISTDLNQLSSSINRNIHDNASLSSTDMGSCSRTRNRESQTKNRLLLAPSWAMEVQRSTVDPKFWAKSRCKKEIDLNQ